MMDALAPVDLRPRLYLCGFPKSGLHMVEQAVSAFVEPVSRNNWFGTMTGGAWTTQWGNLGLVDRIAKTIEPGTYFKGHMGYIPEVADTLYGYGIGVVFVYRDLRDVAVSATHHIINKQGKTWKHPGRDEFMALGGFEDILVAVIEGLGQWAGVFDRWAQYAGWLDAEWVHPVRFEDMRNNAGPTCREMMAYAYKCAASEQGLATVSVLPQHMKEAGFEMVRRIRNRKASNTYRKGTVGGWRKEFTPRAKDVFKALDPGWLAWLGYEDNNDW